MLDERMVPFLGFQSEGDLRNRQAWFFNERVV